MATGRGEPRSLLDEDGRISELPDGSDKKKGIQGIIFLIKALLFRGGSKTRICRFIKQHGAQKR
jgi:hypothetical protein